MRLMLIAIIALMSEGIILCASFSAISTLSQEDVNKKKKNERLRWAYAQCHRLGVLDTFKNNVKKSERMENDVRVQKLIQKNRKIAHRDVANKLFRGAAQLKSRALMDAAIEKGADVNGAGSDGFTPLHICVEANNLKGVKYLIGKGANPGCERKGESIMTYATKIYGKNLSSEQYQILGLLLGGMLKYNQAQ